MLGADGPAAHHLLDRHLRRLEDGLADARRELSRVHALLDTQENPMTTVTLSRADLAAALDSVRFAVGADPELPMLAGVLVDAEADGVTFVATDRHRMALHREPATVDGPPARVIAPVSWVDRLRDRPGRDELVSLRLDSAEIEVSGDGWTIKDTPLAYDYPDYRRAIEARTADGSPSRAPVDVAALRAAVTRRAPGGPTRTRASTTSWPCWPSAPRAGSTWSARSSGVTGRTGTSRSTGSSCWRR